MKVMSVEAADIRRVRGSVQAYLDGQASFKWVTGVIRSTREDIARQVLTDLRGYGDSARYKELSDSFVASTESSRGSEARH